MIISGTIRVKGPWVTLESKGGHCDLLFPPATAKRMELSDGDWVVVTVEKDVPPTQEKR